jgi:hypothetical protein
MFIVDESNELLMELETGIKADTPVNTGTARDGWRITQTVQRVGDTGTLYNDVPYVILLEEGTDTMAPRQFINTNITKSLNRRK